MSSNPIDPRFSSASPSFDDVQTFNGKLVDYTPHGDMAVESASSELGLNRGQSKRSRIDSPKPRVS